MKNFYTYGYLFALVLFLSDCKRVEDPAPQVVTNPPTVITPVYNYGAQSLNLVLGNPSQANDDQANEMNYLLQKEQLVISYNNKAGIPNWVAWHLEKTDLGGTQRQDNFQPDNTLPLYYYWVKPTDYTAAYGFDRGHMCPSGDRTNSTLNNGSTFLMTNISPQSPDLNRGLWQELEAYCRELVYDGNELYIYAGNFGTGGDSPKGRFTTMADGKITIPERLYKIVLVLPHGENDLNRIDEKTPVIAIDVPNSQIVKGKGWEDYITTISAIEAKTKLVFLSTLTSGLANKLKSSKYALPAAVTPPSSTTTVTPPSSTTSTPPTSTTTTPTGDKACGFHNGKQLYIGPKGGCYYINSNGNKTYVDRSECKC